MGRDREEGGRSTKAWGCNTSQQARPQSNGELSESTSLSALKWEKCWYYYKVSDDASTNVEPKGTRSQLSFQLCEPKSVLA